MAQLGDFPRAKELLRRATRAFSPKEAVAHARCIVATAEIALASRDLSWPAKSLDAARATLEFHGDRLNAAFARYLEGRRLLLMGRLDEAEHMLAELDPDAAPTRNEGRPRARRFGDRNAAPPNESRPRSAGPGQARRATGAYPGPLGGGREYIPPPDYAGCPPGWEWRGATPSARRRRSVAGIESARRRRMPPRRAGRTHRRFARNPSGIVCARPLAGRSLAGRCAEGPAPGAGIRSKFTDESHRARLRVEIGRLRRMLRPLAAIGATKRGFALAPHRAREVIVLARPVEEEHAAVLAFLADGEAWSSSALALALGASQRTVQRALDSLASAGKVQSFGRARARRWMTPPVPGFTTILLLPAPLPSD